jgi:hypothetical protein
MKSTTESNDLEVKQRLAIADMINNYRRLSAVSNHNIIDERGLQSIHENDSVAKTLLDTSFDYGATMHCVSLLMNDMICQVEQRINMFKEQSKPETVNSLILPCISCNNESYNNVGKALSDTIHTVQDSNTILANDIKAGKYVCIDLLGSGSISQRTGYKNDTDMFLFNAVGFIDSGKVIDLSNAQASRLETDEHTAGAVSGDLNHPKSFKKTKKKSKRMHRKKVDQKSALRDEVIENNDNELKESEGEVLIKNSNTESPMFRKFAFKTLSFQEQCEALYAYEMDKRRILGDDPCLSSKSHSCLR